MFTNFAVTLDGHTTISGRSGPIGSEADTAILVGLRTAADAVMIGGGTMRAERYGPLAPEEEHRARRERRGLAHAPLAVLVSGRMDLPWDAGMFTCGHGRVLILTSEAAPEPPPTATPIRVERYPGPIDLGRALADLRRERGVRSLLCEGGAQLHGELLSAELVDELFVTIAAKLAGGAGPRLAEGLTEAERPLELEWLLREGDELFARYRVRR